MPVGGIVAKGRKLASFASLEADPHRGIASLQQAIEGARLPALDGFGLCERLGGSRATVLLYCRAGGVPLPADDATLVNGMQGVDQYDGPAQRQAGLDGALAGLLHQAVLGLAPEARRDEPADQLGNPISKRGTLSHAPASRQADAYCSSLTFSIQSTALPSRASCMA